MVQESPTKTQAAVGEAAPESLSLVNTLAEHANYSGMRSVAQEAGYGKLAAPSQGLLGQTFGWCLG